jgi:hypothetical protein
MNKKPIAFDLSLKQKRAIETLAGGRIVRLSGRVVGSKVSVDFVACNAPFLACAAHLAAGNTGFTPCNAPLSACNAHITAGKIAFTVCDAPFKKK